MPLTPANWFYYFTENPKGTVKCNTEGCDYTKVLNKSRSIQCLSFHLQHNHPNLFKQREEFIASEKEKQKKVAQANPLKRCFAQAFSDKTNLAENINATEEPQEIAPILHALKAKRYIWE